MRIHVNEGVPTDQGYEYPVLLEDPAYSVGQLVEVTDDEGNEWLATIVCLHNDGVHVLIED